MSKDDMPSSPRATKLEAVVAELEIKRDSLLDATPPSSDSATMTDDLGTEARAKFAVDAANTRIKAHIRQLQEYNDIKDVGTQLMGLIAEKRGVRIIEVQEDFGIDARD
ncbi:hypothetical protein MBLNU459_g5814t1 [Dothideomycetes sp. NU459]